VWTIGEIVAAPINSTVVANLASAQARGRYQGTFGMSWGLSSMIGPLVGSAVLEGAGPAPLWAACLGGGAVISLGYLATAAGRRARGA
jgi:MFS family permease